MVAGVPASPAAAPTGVPFAPPSGGAAARAAEAADTPFAAVMGALVGGHAASGRRASPGDAAENESDETPAAAGDDGSDATTIAWVSPVLVAFVQALATPAAPAAGGADADDSALGGRAVGGDAAAGMTASGASLPGRDAAPAVATDETTDDGGLAALVSGSATLAAGHAGAPAAPAKAGEWTPHSPAPSTGAPAQDPPAPVDPSTTGLRGAIDASTEVPAPAAPPAPAPAPSPSPSPDVPAALVRGDVAKTDRIAADDRPAAVNAAAATSPAVAADAVAATGAAGWQNVTRRLAGAPKAPAVNPAAATAAPVSSTAADPGATRLAAGAVEPASAPTVAGRTADVADASMPRGARVSEVIASVLPAAPRETAAKLDLAAAPRVAADGGTAVHGPDESLATQIVQSLRVRWTGGATEARVQLRPEYLGELTVAIKVEAGAVVASMRAESAEVRRWIETNTATLREALAEHGLRLDRLEIAAPAESNDAEADTKREAGSSEQEAAPRRRRRRPADDGTPFELHP